MFWGKTLSISAALAATVATAAAAPALGQSRPVVVTAPRDEALPTRRVGYADLDLAKHAGQATLTRRVGAAVREVCVESLGQLPPLLLGQQCRSTAWGSARPQMDRAIQRAREIAQNGTSSIAAGAITISIES